MVNLDQSRTGLALYDFSREKHSKSLSKGKISSSVHICYNSHSDQTVTNHKSIHHVPKYEECL